MSNETEDRLHRGDVVWIARDLGPHMSHFPADREAVVLGSYGDQYGGDNHHSYTVMYTSDGDTTSWYELHQLSFVRHGGEAEIQRIIAEREARQSHERDLAWVVEHWPRIRLNPPGATYTMLMARVGITEPWGSQGEGMALYANWRQTFAALDDALSSGDVSHVEAVIATTRLTPIDVRLR